MAAIVVGTATALAAPMHAQRVSEYQVKAAFLQGFARYVEWPASDPAAESDAFSLCILGDDPFGRWIDDAAAEARIKEKPVVVRRIRQVAESAGCHTLFISASEASRLPAVLESLRSTSALTVSDMPRFAQQGGMIAFVMIAGRVRFVANPGAAQSAGLQLTSELLRVAADVVGAPAPRE